MATTTTNLGLTKPIGTEKALVSVINENMDIIDSKVGAVPQNESVQSQITALNNQMASLIKRVEVLTFNSTDVTQTATKTELIGYAIVSYAIANQNITYNTTKYISDITLNAESGLVSVTRTGTGAFATSKLWVYAIKIPS